MPTIEREKDPFVDALSGYLNLVNEAICDRLLYRKEKKGMPERLSAAGKTLVECAEPGMKEPTERLVEQMGNLKATGRLALRKPSRELHDAVDTLRQFKLPLEERGFMFYSGIIHDDAAYFAGVHMGKGVRVEDGCLRSDILMKNIVEDTQNRFLKEKKSDKRAGGGSSQDGIYYDFENFIVEGLSNWSSFEGSAREEESPIEAKLRKLAYGNLFEEYKGHEAEFAIAVGLMNLVATGIPHEFHHKHIARPDGKVGRSVQETGAYLYSLSKATTPESVFANLNLIYGLNGEGPDTIYGRAASAVFDYLVRTGYSEDILSGLEPKEHEKTSEVSKIISGQAKRALDMFENENGVAKHARVELELKPDFEKYGAMVMYAVVGKLGAI